MTSRCAFCESEGVEATTTIDGGYGSLTVTISGVPAIACVSCGKIGVSGPVAEAIDQAITDILVATKAISAPSAAEEMAEVAEDASATSAAAEVAELTVTR